VLCLVCCAQEERRRQQIRTERAAKEASLAAKAGQLSAIRRLASAQAGARKAAATAQRSQTGGLTVPDACVYCCEAAEGVSVGPQLVFRCHSQALAVKKASVTLFQPIPCLEQLLSCFLHYRSGGGAAAARDWCPCPG
jgi:hypothetical protein